MPSFPLASAVPFSLIGAVWQLYDRHGAVKRVRPKMMTVMATFMGLLPIMWSTGAGSDVMKRIAAPMVGGLSSSFLLELVVYPVIYAMWKWQFEMKRGTVILQMQQAPVRGHAL